MVQQNGDSDPSTRIAKSAASNLRVLAGPGTGKTHTLKLRVKHLLENEVTPKSILVTTFTRTAAEELRKELEEMDVLGASDVDATTVHALCFSILNRKGVLENLRRVPRVLLEFEKRFLLEDLKHELKTELERELRHVKKRKNHET